MKLFSTLWFQLGVIIICSAVLLFGFHILLQWMEDRGWIYYRKKKASPGTVSSALLELHSLLEPGKKHVLVIEREERKEQEDSGGPK